MKNIFTILGIILFTSFTYSCKKDKPTPPVVTTSDVTEISYTTATSGGEVTNEGGAPVTSRGVCWNSSVDPTIGNSKTNESGGIGSFTSNITQLTPNTNYYVRAYATNSAGTSYGNHVTFTTSQITTATLTTASISSITSITAVSGGIIIADNGGSVTARGVCWGTTTSPTTANNVTSNGTGIGSFISNLIGLQPGTVYYVRAYATNNIGTAYGNEVNFTTISIPSITTSEVTSITPTTATSGGNITSDGRAPVTASGVCWSTSENPTISSYTTIDGTGIGAFTSSLTGLTPNTTYYVRAYATNSAGTGYGSSILFTTQIDVVIFNPNLTYGTITDIDGNVYKTISIGTQTWMAENLKTGAYNDGTSVLLVTDNTAWLNLNSSGYCWYSNYAPTNKNTYGALYNWYAVSTGKLCPINWHVPSDAEWTTLTDYLANNGYGYEGSGVDIAKSMAAVSLWNIHFLAGTIGKDLVNNNSSGFSALPGGSRAVDGTFYLNGYYGYWWSSTESSATSAWKRILIYSSENMNKANGYKIEGYSVRCLKD